MDIRSLTLVLTDQDLEELARRQLPGNFPVEELQLRITSEGVLVAGEYPLFVHVHFEMLWTLAVENGKVRAQLERVRALGLPATIFRSMVLKLVQEQIGKSPWVEHDGDGVLVDVDRWVREKGVPLRSHLRSVRCHPGEMIIEGGI